MKKYIILLLLLLIPIKIYALQDNTKSIAVIDLDSQRFLYEKNANEPSLIASTTKIMTAIIAIENSNLDDLVSIKDEVLKAYGSNIYIERGEHMIMLDLLYGLMMRSGNDASLAIANHVSKNEQEFIKLMNKKAKALNMHNTIFKNPHGLDEETKNYSTAHDMALLLSYASKNKDYMMISSKEKYQTTTDKKAYSWTNRVELLKKYNKLTSGKTGYTPASGRILATTASNNNLNLGIFSINKNTYDYKLHQNIYEEYFNKYKNIKILDQHNFNLKYNKYDKLYIKTSFTYPLTKEEQNRIDIKYNIKQNKKYKQNQQVGTANIYLNNNLIGTRKIYIHKKELTLYEKIKSFFTKQKK